MKTSAIIFPIVLISSAHALAAPQTYSMTIVSNRATVQVVSDTQIVPGGPSSAASALDGASARASADFGVIKLFADAPDDRLQAQAVGSYRDTITLSGSGGVPITISFLATGTVSNYRPGTGNWAYDIEQHLTGDFTSLSSRVVATTETATGLVTIPVSFSGTAFAGVPLDLFAYFAIYTSGEAFSAFKLDFSHTALLIGLTVPDGVTVTSATFGLLPTNVGAFTYPAVLRELAPPVDTPAPAAVALFGIGAGLLIAAQRRSRARPSS